MPRYRIFYGDPKVVEMELPWIPEQLKEGKEREYLEGLCRLVRDERGEDVKK